MRRPLLLLFALAGCARNIPGTDIADTRDNRAIVAVIDDYRRAMERRDVAAALTLVSPSYFDDAGTGDPSDDLDAAQLARALLEIMQRVPALKLEIAVNRIEVDGDAASAFLFHDSRYRVATPRGEVAKRDSDLHRMTLRREGASWRITSGL